MRKISTSSGAWFGGSFNSPETWNRSSANTDCAKVSPTNNATKRFMQNLCEEKAEDASRCAFGLLLNP